MPVAKWIHQNWGLTEVQSLRTSIPSTEAIWDVVAIGTG